MKKSKFNVTRLLVLMTLCCALMVGNLFIPSIVAEAATKKTTISATEMTIPVGKMSSKIYWNVNSWELNNAQKLSVKNTVKGATYQFTSSSTKVVTISKDGGYLTGVNAGSATITCTQTYKNKKTTIGKCKVTVKKAVLETNDYNNEFPVGSGVFDLSHYYSDSSNALFNITYRNPKATYTLTSDSKNFSIKEIKYDASKVKEVSDWEEYQSVLKDFIGERYIYGYQFTAKEAGTYTITVKETYNKKTKTMGSFKVEIKDTSISEPNVDLLLGNNLNVFNLLKYTKDINYYFAINDYDETNQDNNVLRLSEQGSELYLYGNKTGTAEVTIREGSEEGTLIGTVTIVVSEAPCESIIVDSEEYTTYVDDDFRIYYDLEPWETTDKVSIESDKPDVLKVEYDQEEDYWTYTPLKVGEANITIKCGDKSVVCKVVVEEY